MTAHAVFDLEGMHCASCVSNVEQAIRTVAAVSEAQVSLPLHTARVELSSADPAALRDVVAAVARAGFRATARGGDDAAGDALQQEAAAARRRLAQVDAARRRFGLALVAEVPLLALTIATLAGAALPGWTAWLQLALAALVMMAGRSIYSIAARLALRARANMDTLVALGTGVAFGASLHGLATGGHLHFGPVGMIVTLVLLGRFLEARAQGQTGEALRRLLDLTPATARRVDAAGEAREVPLRDLRPGDLIRVLPGETIPVDGEVASGSASVSEAMLTGESAPIAKGPGDAVVGGTLDLDGSLTVRTARVGDDTRLAGIVRLVAAAQGSKAAVERLADRVSAVFVPLITLLALLTGAAWWLLRPDLGAQGALLAAVAVLVVACPCALGLATPTAVVVAVGRAARGGILIREASALERLRDVTHVVFDKTGTLTRGEFAVTGLTALGGTAADPLLCWTAALEAHSEHPLARGIVRERTRRGLPALAATEVEVAVGGGVRGKVAGTEVRVGAPAWLADAGVDLADLPSASAGTTQVAVARAGTLVGALDLADEVRATAPEAIRALQAAGLTCVLLSGDRREVAETVGAALGIEDVRAEVTPEGKLAAIDALQQAGARVAMVGDGLNDAPALARAEVGIAMGQGVDVAREAAAVTLLRDDPRAVAEVVLLARATLRTIRQNLAWAFGYNVVTVPLAMLKVLHPVAAAGAMAASSVLVVFNSLRLRRAGTNGEKR